MSFYTKDERFSLLRAVVASIAPLKLTTQPLSKEERERKSNPKTGSWAWCTAVHAQRIVETLESVEEKRANAGERGQAEAAL